MKKYTLLKSLLLSLLLVGLLLPNLLFSASADGFFFWKKSAQTEDESISEYEESIEPSPSAETVPEKITLRINEVMVKNHSGICDEDGERGDWIELYNYGEEPVELKGLSLAESSDSRWIFKKGAIPAGGYLVVFADNKDKEGDYPHTDFALSAGEELRLSDENNELIDSALCDCDTADIALISDGKGGFTRSGFSSPGHENTASGYAKAQEELECDCPIQINELMVYNDRDDLYAVPKDCDWIELKNISDKKVQLSDYYISDDHKELEKFRLPSLVLKPGELTLLVCGEDSRTDHICLPFNLNSERERVYLSCGNKVEDCVFLHDIPYGGSFGRLSDENGFFYFATPTPLRENSSGCRGVSSAPVAKTADGIFNDVSTVVAELNGVGTIHYTTDGSMPTEKSPVYTKEIDIHKTGVVRSICVEEGCLPSEVLTQSFIINENHTLPVASLTLDDPKAFERMYIGAKKDVELSGNLSFYSEEGEFSIPCGVEMHGESSLSLKKKNLSLKFRAAYGQGELNFDLFGGGVTSFSSLLLRAGQGQSEAVFVSEFVENLALQFSDELLSQRSRYCILYVNGEYYGIYALMEKVDKDYYAHYFNVDRDSVTVLKAPVEIDSEFSTQVIDFARKNDLRQESVYEEFCRRVDIDSLIDWLIIEGFSQNTDLNPGNVRYCRSTQDDGRWRHMLYDLDATMKDASLVYKNVFGLKTAPYSPFVQPLLMNETFREAFLTRAGQVYRDVLNEENVLAEFDRLTELLRPEIERDFRENGFRTGNWQEAVNERRGRIAADWCGKCKAAICQYLSVEESDWF